MCRDGRPRPTMCRDGRPRPVMLTSTGRILQDLPTEPWPGLGCRPRVGNSQPRLSDGRELTVSAGRLAKVL